MDVTLSHRPVTVITVETSLPEHRSSHQQQARLTRCQWVPQMTTSLMSKIPSKIRDASLAIGVAICVTAFSPTASFAYTAEAQQMCTGDAFRLCSSEIPNIPAITACMMKHRADLSPGCRAVMDKDLAKGASRKVADANESAQ